MLSVFEKVCECVCARARVCVCCWFCACHFSPVPCTHQWCRQPHLGCPRMCSPCPHPTKWLAFSHLPAWLRTPCCLVCRSMAALLLLPFCPAVPNSPFPIGPHDVHVGCAYLYLHVKSFLLRESFV